MPGLDLLRAIQAVQQRGERVSKDTLAPELVRAGFFQARASTHMTAMASWLRAAGVLGPPDGWAIQGPLVKELSGVDLGDVDAWSSLSRIQRAFLGTLRRLAEASGLMPVRATFLNDQVELEHGHLADSDKLRSQVYAPLATAGWVVIAGPVKGKSGTITPTQRLLDADLVTMTRLTAGQLPSELRPLLDTPIATIRLDLRSSDTHVKGIALELLAIRLATDLGLLPVHFRLRGVDSTGGAEVDLVAEGAHLHFSRWLFQCKNTSQVGLSTIAREVGMATLLRAGIVVVITTGRFASSVRPFVDILNGSTTTQVFLVDGALLAHYASAGPSFHRRCLSGVHPGRHGRPPSPPRPVPRAHRRRESSHPAAALAGTEASQVDEHLRPRRR